MSQKRSGFGARAGLLAVALLSMLSASCHHNRYGEFDSIAKRESSECPLPRVATAINVRGIYENQGIRLDYQKLVPLPDPSKGVDMDAVVESFSNPRQLEQVYHHAMASNGQAIWLACQYDVAARNIGRQAARYLASLKCQTFFRCHVDFPKLPFSQDTASGARLLDFIGREFQHLSDRLGVEQDLAFRVPISGILHGRRKDVRAGRTASPRCSTRISRRLARGRERACGPVA